MQLKSIPFVFLCCSVFVLSCNLNGDYIQSDDHNIYEVVINSKIKPFPPPPPKLGDSISKIGIKVIDSLNDIQLRIAVSPFKFIIKDDFQYVHKNLNRGKIYYVKSKLKVKPRELVGRESLKFNLLKDEKIDFEKTLKSHDGILFLSKIIYNKTKDKALVIVGYTTSSLSSSTILYLLDKNKDTWIIINSRRLSVS
jgi:hypothetical protein